MKTIVPSYYKRFQCIAGECRHNCCLEGWEIDIDDAHVNLYKKLAQQESNSADLLNGLYLPTAKERKNGAVPHIRLNDNGVCPYLNEAGLCRLILQYGEKTLCQICADHPRFRNYPKGHCELGLGLCCEEACRIILEDHETGNYEELQSGKSVEPAYRALGLLAKEKELFKKKLDFNAWAEYLLGLERLEEGWQEVLERFISLGKQQTERPCCTLERTDIADPGWMRRFENLNEYYLYRYGCTDGLGFASFSVRLIYEIAKRFELDARENGACELLEICRMYSSEIEYSEENRSAIIQKLKSEDYQ